MKVGLSETFRIFLRSHSNASQRLKTRDSKTMLYAYKDAEGMGKKLQLTPLSCLACVTKLVRLSAEEHRFK